MAGRNLISKLCRFSSFAYLKKSWSSNVSIKLALFSSAAYTTCRLVTLPVAFARQTKKENDKVIIAEAEKRYNSNDSPKDVYDYLINYKESKNADILWRLSRAARDVALKTEGIDSKEKKRLVYEAFQFASNALKADDDNFASHKWYAITIGDVGDYEGTKVKISNAFVIRDHLERAAELNPSDATTLHCLGMWCFVFADMPGWQHTIAGFLFATPPTSNYKDAAEYFTKAERVQPNFYSVNLLMLGKAYKKIGDVKRAMLYLDRTIHYPVLNAEDEAAKKEAEELLKELMNKK